MKFTAYPNRKKPVQQQRPSTAIKKSFKKSLFIVILKKVNKQGPAV